MEKEILEDKVETLRLELSRREAPPTLPLDVEIVGTHRRKPVKLTAPDDYPSGNYLKDNGG